MDQKPPQNFYVVVGENTVVSVVKTGRLPDISLEKELLLCRTPLEAIKKTRYTYQSAIMLVLAIPDVSEQWLMHFIRRSDGTYVAKGRQIEVNWIRRILVSNQMLYTKLRKKFGIDQPIQPIEVNHAFFDLNPLVLQAQQPKPEFIPESEFSSQRSEDFLIYRQGDLLGSKAQTLINTVNCMGVMGKGIAYSFKERYPDMFKDYQERCEQEQIKIGEPYLYKASEHRWIINFPTKNHWKNKSQLAWIEKGLIYLSKKLQEWGVISLAVPPLGCGNGGLKWDNVKPLVEKYLCIPGIPIEIYAPFKREAPGVLPALKKSRGSPKKPDAMNFSQMRP